jgi:predicted amidophosphoribosyltransferase
MKKSRLCLRCDKKFMTTPEIRICPTCKGQLKHQSWYYNNCENSVISTMPVFVKPLDTRSKNE